MTITIKYALERAVVPRHAADRIPVNAIKVNICGKFEIFPCELRASVSRLFIYFVSEPNKFVYIVNKERICFRTATLEPINFKGCIYRCGVRFRVGSRRLRKVNTAVTGFALNYNACVVRNIKRLTCFNTETCLGNTRKFNFRVTANRVITTEEHATIKVGHINFRIFNDNIIPRRCIYANNIEVKRRGVFHQNFRAVKKVKVGIIPVKTNQICTRNARCNEFYVIKRERLVCEHPEHCRAGFYARVNNNRTILKRRRTKIKVVLRKRKLVTVQIDNRRFGNCSLALQSRRCVCIQDNRIAFYCRCKCCFKRFVFSIADFSDTSFSRHCLFSYCRRHCALSKVDARYGCEHKQSRNQRN